MLPWALWFMPAPPSPSLAFTSALNQPAVPEAGDS